MNSLFAREARDQFDVPATCVAVGRGGTAVTPAVLARQRSHALFDRPKDVERWSVRLRHGDARLERWRFRGGPTQPAAELGGAADPWLVLAIERGGSVEPMHDGITPREGDLAHVLIFAREAERAAEALSARAWSRRRLPRPSSRPRATALRTPFGSRCDPRKSKAERMP